MAQQLLDDEHGREQHLPRLHLAQHAAQLPDTQRWPEEEEEEEEEESQAESQVWWWELEHRARAAESKAARSTASALLLGRSGPMGPDVADPPLPQPLALGGDDQRGDVVDSTLGLLLALDPPHATLSQQAQPEPPQSLAQPLALGGGDQRGDVAKPTLVGPTLLEQPHLVVESPPMEQPHLVVESPSMEQPRLVVESPPMEQHLDTLVAERERREREQKRRDRETYMAAAGWTDRKKELWRYVEVLVEQDHQRHIALPPFKKRLLSNKEPINLCD